MTPSSLVSFWRELAENVHPRDQSVFADGPMGFNIDYPPPAFVGAVDTAPVVVLMKMGGYDPVLTPSEFPNTEAVNYFRYRIHNPSSMNPSHISPYYASLNFGDYFLTGELALVNAVPYRVHDKNNIAPALDGLASLKAHRAWLRDELMPAAERHERLIVAHQIRLWDMPAHSKDAAVLRTRNPVSRSLTMDVLDHISGWLARRMP